MRVAIYEPNPRVGGSIVWSRHAQAGFRELGHDCDVVASTASGKVPTLWQPEAIQRADSIGNRWAQFTPDVVVKDADLLGTLRGYDLTVLPDAWSVLHDNRAVKAEKLPFYLTTLGRLGTEGGRWTTVMHGTAATYARAWFTRVLLHETAGFTGRVVCHFPLPTELPERLQGLDLVSLPLPYAPICGLGEPVQQDRTIGMTGRLVPIKGAHLLLAAVEAGTVPSDWDVQLHGGADVGYGDAYSHQLWATLRGLGWEPAYEKDPNVNPKRSLPWDLQKDHRPEVSYHGAYRYGATTARQLRVHCTLTNESVVSYTEYATLEAIDAGCLIVAPARNLSDEYTGYAVGALGKTTLKSVLAGKHPDVVGRVNAAVLTACKIAGDDETVTRMARVNRERLRWLQDPRTTAKALMGEM